MVQSRLYRRAIVAIGVVAVLGAAGCGDDDDAADGDLEAYCEVARALDEQEGFPTVEQLEELKDNAPEAIADDVEFAADRFIEAIEEDGLDESIFDDPDLAERFDRIEAFEAENCGTGDGEDEGDEGAVGDIAPEHAEYCAASAELDEQEDFPSAEQLEALKGLAPEEIAAEVTLAADALIADGPGAFSDPEVNTALEAIEAFEAEACGAGDEDEGDGASDVIDPDATRVDVVATEYAFEFEAPPAGPTSFVMANEGQEAHFMFIVRLNEGFTFDEAFEAVSADESRSDEFIAEEFESDTVGPGEEAVLTADLEPGVYGMMCFIPAPDGEPHAFKGMRVGFEVS